MRLRTKEDLSVLIGEPESNNLEFKSSRELNSTDINKIRGFVSQSLSKAVSAMLNSDGGILVVGVEERDGKADFLSPGVPRKTLSWERLQSMLVDSIQPAVSDLVSVHSVNLGRSISSEEDVFAFVIEVKAGSTAYQAFSKIYYARRSGQSFPMDDKDIRLRMLAGDKPRLGVQLEPRDGNNSVFWDLKVSNVGIKTIPRCLVRFDFRSSGLSESGEKIVAAKNSLFVEEFEHVGVDYKGLMPGDTRVVYSFDLSGLVFYSCSEDAELFVNARVLIDDGLPSEILNFDLMISREILASRGRL